MILAFCLAPEIRLHTFPVWKWRVWDQAIDGFRESQLPFDQSTHAVIGSDTIALLTPISSECTVDVYLPVPVLYERPPAWELDIYKDWDYSERKRMSKLEYLQSTLLTLPILVKTLSLPIRDALDKTLRTELGLFTLAPRSGTDTLNPIWKELGPPAPPASQSASSSHNPTQLPRPIPESLSRLSSIFPGFERKPESPIQQSVDQVANAGESRLLCRA